jgi:Putative prokaryotic signal transducing protein
MQMVRLTTCADGFEARVLAARLGADGIVWSLRGGHDGPFAIGEVDVLVDADDYALARQLLESDLDWDGELAAPDASPERPTTGRDLLLALGALAFAILFAVVRMTAKV